MWRVKVLEGAFNQEMALVGASSVTDNFTDGLFAALLVKSLSRGTRDAGNTREQLAPLCNILHNSDYRLED